jgi:formylglycine-generating enzyme required for sulfatase activity
MIEIPAGSFMMGVPAGSEGIEAKPEIAARKITGRAVPQHRVSVGAFALGKYEVTVAEFKAFVAETKYTSGDECEIYAQDPKDKRWKMVHSNYSWRDPGFPQTDRHPAVCISWPDAKAYVAWLSKKTGHTYRLPSEAEWEYAARAGTQTRWYWGSDRNQGCKYANAGDQTLATQLARHSFDDETNQFDCSDGYAHAAPVGTFKPNAFGLYDMLGNMFEWVEDCMNVDYQGAPTDGSAVLTGSCERRFLRGGSWTLNSHAVSADFRAGNVIENKESTHGFRVARTK